MTVAQAHLETNVLWAAIFTLILLGVVLVGVVTLVQNRLLRWARVGTDESG